MGDLNGLMRAERVSSQGAAMCHTPAHRHGHAELVLPAQESIQGRPAFQVLGEIF